MHARSHGGATPPPAVCADAALPSARTRMPTNPRMVRMFALAMGASPSPCRSSPGIVGREPESERGRWKSMTLTVPLPRFGRESQNNDRTFACRKIVSTPGGRALRRSAAVLLATIATAACATAGPACVRGTGTHDGHFYTSWRDADPACMTLGEGGRYTVAWDLAGGGNM